MKAIILAAGYGRRMRPITNTTHKTLIDVGSMKIIDRIIDALLQHSVNYIVIVTGYMYKELKEYLLKKYPNVKIHFVLNKRYNETNNIFSMALAFEKIKLDEDILLIESDIVFEPSVITRIIDSPYQNVALVDHFRSGMDGTVVTVKDDIITNVIPPHLQTEDFVFSDKFKTLNIYKFSKEFCKNLFKKLLTYYARTIDDNCYYELILGILIYMQRENINAEIIHNELWAEVDDPNDLFVAEFLFNNYKSKMLQTQMGGYWNYDFIDFSFIRNMYFPPSALISEMKNALPKLIQNYGSIQDILNQKLAWFLLCKKECVRVLNGVSQIYPILHHICKGRVLIPTPTFGEYPRIFKNASTYSDEVGIDMQEVENKSKDCKVIVFVNPNNPTGSEIQTELIYKFAKENKKKFIIIDESFIEFSKYASIINILEEQKLKNILVIKSLSKSLGVPGLRLGYIYSCDVGFLQQIDEYIPIWNLNSLSEFYLETILKYRDFLLKSIIKTKEDREIFIEKLKSVKIIEKVYPSGGNFILVLLKKTSPEPLWIVNELINKHNIFIKDISGKFKKGKYLRFGVRLPEENEKLIKFLNKINGEKND